MFRRFVFVLLVLSAVLTFVLARRIARESGKTMVEALPEVPGEARHLYDEVMVRVKDATQAGKEAAVAKQQEIQDYLEGRKG